MIITSQQYDHKRPEGQTPSYFSQGFRYTGFPTDVMDEKKAVDELMRNAVPFVYLPEAKWTTNDGKDMLRTALQANKWWDLLSGKYKPTEKR